MKTEKNTSIFTRLIYSLIYFTLSACQVEEAQDHTIESFNLDNQTTTPQAITRIDPYFNSGRFLMMLNINAVDTTYKLNFYIEDETKETLFFTYECNPSDTCHQDQSILVFCRLSSDYIIDCQANGYASNTQLDMQPSFAQKLKLHAEICSAFNTNCHRQSLPVVIY